MKRAPKDQELLKILKDMEFLRAEYPEELRAARRASFLEQVEQTLQTQPEEQTDLQEQKVVNQLRSLGAVPVKYPPRLLAARRAAFARQIVWLQFVNLCTAVWSTFQKRIFVPVLDSRQPAMQAMSTSLVVASMAFAVFVGYFLYGNYQAALSPASSPQTGTINSGLILTSDAREVSIVCKPPAEPPLCLAGEYQKPVKLTFQGNGLARPAVAKDTMPGLDTIHRASFVNDGLYGPGASWISNSRNSWIKIDLGKVTKINTVTFGRDRLGKLNGHNPGQFVVSLALTDNVYANGNNSNDNREYKLVYDSKKTGFSGEISGPETVIAQFTPREARYIKITFENKGAAIDEVEAFLAQTTTASKVPSQTSREKSSRNSSDSQPASTLPPAFTATSQPVATVTSLPTTITTVPSETATTIPTATVILTNTPVPTSTFVPTSTHVPTNPPTLVPTDTPLPPPTSTPAPPNTDTPVPTEPTAQTDLSSRSDDYEIRLELPINP